jgi:hypothetical protein
MDGYARSSLPANAQHVESGDGLLQEDAGNCRMSANQHPCCKTAKSAVAPDARSQNSRAFSPKREKARRPKG